jgi:hypothetical protein
MKTQSPVTPEEKETQVAALAYAIWEDAGRPDGKSVEHWFRAKKQVEQDYARAEQVRNQLPPSR